jgi:hypothetical protein
MKHKKYKCFCFLVSGFLLIELYMERMRSCFYMTLIIEVVMILMMSSPLSCLIQDPDLNNLFNQKNSKLGVNKRCKFIKSYVNSISPGKSHTTKNTFNKVLLGGKKCSELLIPLQKQMIKHLAHQVFCF